MISFWFRICKCLYTASWHVVLTYKDSTTFGTVTRYKIKDSFWNKIVGNLFQQQTTIIQMFHPISTGHGNMGLHKDAYLPIILPSNVFVS